MKTLIQIALLAALTPALAHAQEPNAEEDRWRVTRNVSLAAASVGVVSMPAGAVIALGAVTDGGGSPSLEAKLSRRRTLGQTMMIGGVALSAVSIPLAVTSSARTNELANERALSATFVPTEGGGGLALSGRF